MRALVLALVCLASLAHAQTCPCPQADLFSALEPDTHEGPGNAFRGLMPDTTGAQCATDSTITSLVQSIPQNSPSEQVVAPGLGGLIFAIRFTSEFATVAGADTGPCFRLDVHNFTHPPSPITFTDGCGTHTMTIGQPKYACVLGPPIGKTLVCFAAKTVGPKAPLPPGFDRLEDVCALVDLL
jgi:hypothetical protein